MRATWISADLIAAVRNSRSRAAADPTMNALRALIPMAILTLLTSGCSLLTQPPRDDAIRQAEASKAEAARSGAIGARARQLEDKGMSSREARAIADTESRLRGR